jgi:hypothetical protein
MCGGSPRRDKWDGVLAFHVDDSEFNSLHNANRYVSIFTTVLPQVWRFDRATIEMCAASSHAMP